MGPFSVPASITSLLSRQTHSDQSSRPSDTASPVFCFTASPSRHVVLRRDFLRVLPRGREDFVLAIHLPLPPGAPSRERAASAFAESPPVPQPAESICARGPAFQGAICPRAALWFHRKNCHKWLVLLAYRQFLRQNPATGPQMHAFWLNDSTWKGPTMRRFILSVAASILFLGGWRSA